MRARLRSKHLLDEQLLVKIWQRSEATEADRHYPLGKKFEDWCRKPNTDLGLFSSDYLYFWMNWIFTNKEMVPVMDLAVIGEPESWRIFIELDAAEKEKSAVITEGESSVYVYRSDTEELTRFRLVRKDGPRLIESRVEEIPEWVAKKIAAAKEERDPETLKSWLNSLSARILELKQRRITSSTESA
jgi:hypothetical protein